MTYYATPRDEWPSRAELAADGPDHSAPLVTEERAALVAHLADAQAAHQGDR